MSATGYRTAETCDAQYSSTLEDWHCASDPVFYVPLEESRHAYSILPAGWGPSEGLCAPMLPGKRDSRIHGGNICCNL